MENKVIYPTEADIGREVFYKPTRIGEDYQKGRVILVTEHDEVHVHLGLYRHGVPNVVIPCEKLYWRIPRR